MCACLSVCVTRERLDAAYKYIFMGRVVKKHKVLTANMYTQV